MSVAVLIVTYRSYDALDRSLASLAPHLSPGDEVVVVDFESDAARAAVSAARLPAARWITRTDNLGFAAGVNLAAAATSADTLLLLNPDTLVEGPVIRALDQFLAIHPRCAAAGPRILNADGSVQASARRFPDVTTVLGGRSAWLSRRWPDNWFSRRNLLALGRTAPCEVEWVSGACLATPRAVFDRLGGLDESFFMYWEDADYCRRGAALGLMSMYVPTVTVTHTGGVSAGHNVAAAIQAFHDSAFRLYWKHSGWGRRLAAPLVWTGLRARGILRAWQARG